MPRMMTRGPLRKLSFYNEKLSTLLWYTTLKNTFQEIVNERNSSTALSNPLASCDVLDVLDVLNVTNALFTPVPCNTSKHPRLYTNFPSQGNRKPYQCK